MKRICGNIFLVAIFLVVGCSWIGGGIEITKPAVAQAAQIVDTVYISIDDESVAVNYWEGRNNLAGKCRAKGWQGNVQLSVYNDPTNSWIPAADHPAYKHLQYIIARKKAGNPLAGENALAQDFYIDQKAATQAQVVPRATKAQKATVVQQPVLEKRVTALETRNLYEDVEARIKALPGNPFDGSIKKFQIAEGLKADGIPGEKTLWMLRRAEALPRVKALGYDSFYDFQKVWGIKMDNLWGDESEATLKKAEEINKKYFALIKERLGLEIKEFQCQYRLEQRGSVDPATKAQADKVLGLLDQKRSEEIIETAPKPECSKTPNTATQSKK